MKRRNFILSGSALAVISLSITATTADIVDSVSATGDFRMLITDVSSSLRASPNLADESSTHTWELMNAYIEEDITAVVVDYPNTTSFDGLDSDDIMIEFERREDNFRVMDLEDAEYSGSSARFVIDDSQPTLVDEATVEIDGIENPDPGSYTPEISFETDERNYTTNAELNISSDDAFFVVEIDAVDDVVEEGESITVAYTVTNTDGGIGSQEIVFSVDGTGQNTEEITLEVGDSKRDTFSYRTDSDDGSSVDINVASDDTNESRTVGIGGWNLDVDPEQQNSDAVHTWSNGFPVFEGEIETIEIEYETDSQDVDLDDIEIDSITVELTREGENGPTEVTVTNITTANTGNQPDLTIELDDTEETSIDGELIVEVDDIRNPNQGFNGTITLIGDDETSSDSIRIDL